jgi:transcriptional regulator with XRE-family HTH domain
LLTASKQNDLYEILGEQIRIAREKANINQEHLAQYLDLSRVSISNIEKGKQKIQLHSLLELAKYLQIEIDYFLSPLYKLLHDEVSEEEERRITHGLGFPANGKLVDDGAKVKEFLNFTKSKDQ